MQKGQKIYWLKCVKRKMDLLNNLYFHVSCVKNKEGIFQLLLNALTVFIYQSTKRLDKKYTYFSSKKNYWNKIKHKILVLNQYKKKMKTIWYWYIFLAGKQKPLSYSGNGKRNKQIIEKLSHKGSVIKGRFVSRSTFK